MEITKQYLRENIPFALAVPGRPFEYLHSDDDALLPVSCTVFSVEDSMEGKNGIEDSWIFTSRALRHGAGVAVDLSKLRAKGSKSRGSKLVASGPVSFLKFYNDFNDVLRRGGLYKNGAITAFLDWNHPDLLEFISDTYIDEYPWVKRAVYVDQLIFNKPDVLAALLEKVGKGTIWLAKKRHDLQGNRLYSNVCLEVLLPHRGTCLLASQNLGQYKIDTWSEAYLFANDYAESMEWLCHLHGLSGVSETDYYLPSRIDRQVGLGFVGLANFLAINEVSYKDFGYALTDRQSSDKARLLAEAFRMAYEKAAHTAYRFNMERAFAIAPTASMSYRHTDLEGYTLSMSLQPPLEYEVERDSDTFGTVEYEYNPKCELARNVDYQDMERIYCEFQAMMNDTGLAHTISADLWSTEPVDFRWFSRFMLSSQVTTYYRTQVNQTALDKTSIMLDKSCDLNYCEACGS